MRYYVKKSVILLVLSFSMIQLSVASTFRSQTARLTSTAGVGVGSILINESTQLNPASAAFFRNSLFYSQKSEYTANNKQFEGEGMIVSASDTTTRLKGSLSYESTEENGIETQRFSGSMATALRKNLSGGLVLSHIDDESQEDPYQTAGIGFTYVYSPRVTLGLVANDLTEETQLEQTVKTGFQYTVLSDLIVMGDIGTNRNEESEKRLIYGAAAQFKLYKHLYARAGKSIDKNQGLSTNGYGVSWLGPKLGLEYAFRSLEGIGEGFRTLAQDQSLEEHILSLSLVF